MGVPACNLCRFGRFLSNVSPANVPANNRAERLPTLIDPDSDASDDSDDEGGEEDYLPPWIPPWDDSDDEGGEEDYLPPMGPTRVHRGRTVEHPHVPKWHLNGPEMPATNGSGIKTHADWQILGVVLETGVSDEAADKFLALMNRKDFDSKKVTANRVTTLRDRFANVFGTCKVGEVDMHMPVDGDQSVVLYTRDAGEAAWMMRANPATEGLLYKRYKKKLDCDGIHVVGPANSAVRWQLHQEMNPDSNLLMVNVGSDGAAYLKKEGIHPISLTLSNIPEHLRVFPQFMCVVGFVPILR